MWKATASIRILHYREMGDNHPRLSKGFTIAIVAANYALPTGGHGSFMHKMHSLRVDSGDPRLMPERIPRKVHVASKTAGCDRLCGLSFGQVDSHPLRWLEWSRVVIEHNVPVATT